MYVLPVSVIDVAATPPNFTTDGLLKPWPMMPTFVPTVPEVTPSVMNGEKPVSKLLEHAVAVRAALLGVSIQHSIGVQGKVALWIRSVGVVKRVNDRVGASGGNFIDHSAPPVTRRALSAERGRAV